jgi:hypothetical protein
VGLATLSPSRLQTLNCPHRFLELYMKGYREPDNQALAHGRLIHQVAALYFHHLKKEKLATDHTFLEVAADKAWEKRQDVIPDSASDDHETFINQLREVVIDPATIAGVEQRVSFHEDWEPAKWDDPMTAYRGVLDLCTVEGPKEEQFIHVRDWTTAALAGQFQAAKDLQLRIYALMMHKITKRDRIKVTVHSLRTGAEKSVELVGDEHIVTESRITLERKRLLAHLDDPDYKWPAVPGAACSYCTLNCPYEARYQDTIRLILGEGIDIHEFHKQLIFLESQRKKMVELLKGYVGQHGNVVTGDIEARFNLVERRSYSIGDLLITLQAAGIPDEQIYETFSVDKRKLKKLLKGNDELYDQVEEITTIQHTERFAPTAKIKEE